MFTTQTALLGAAALAASAVVVPYTQRLDASSAAAVDVTREEPARPPPVDEGDRLVARTTALVKSEAQAGAIGSIADPTLNRLGTQVSGSLSAMMAAYQQVGSGDWLGLAANVAGQAAALTESSFVDSLAQGLDLARTARDLLGSCTTSVTDCAFDLPVVLGKVGKLGKTMAFSAADTPAQPQVEYGFAQGVKLTPYADYLAQQGVDVEATLAMYDQILLGEGELSLTPASVRFGDGVPTPTRPEAPAATPPVRQPLVPLEVASIGPSSSPALIKQYQAQLNLPQTGVWDADTTRRTREFQQAHGLTVDGEAGLSTLSALGFLPDSAGQQARVGSSASALGNGYLPSSVKLDEVYPHHNNYAELREPVIGPSGVDPSANWPSPLAVPRIEVGGQAVSVTSTMPAPLVATTRDIAATDFTVGFLEDESRDVGRPLVAPSAMRVVDTDPASGLVVLENTQPRTITLPDGKVAQVYDRIAVLHCDQVLAKVGDTVAAGQVVATQGRTATRDVHAHIVGTNQMRLDFINAQSNLTEHLRRQQGR